MMDYEDYDEDVELYPQDRRTKEKNPDFDDDPWEDYGEGWAGEDDSDMS